MPVLPLLDQAQPDMSDCHDVSMSLLLAVQLKVSHKPGVHWHDWLQL